MSGHPPRTKHQILGTITPTWRLAPYPVLAVDPAGAVAGVNEAGRLLFAGAVPGTALADAVPGWLARAHQRFTERPPADPRDRIVRGKVGERFFEAHPTASGTLVLWWLMARADRPERDGLAGLLAAERERTSFLAAASRELSSLDVESCLDSTVALARYLADVALVVSPDGRRDYTAVQCGPEGRVRTGRLGLDPGDVPGLAEVLHGYPPVPSQWIAPDSVPGRFLCDGVGEPGSMMVTALADPGGPDSALVLVRRHDRPRFSEDEEEFARAFAALAGTALAAARRHAEQMSITEVLIQDLLPPRTRDLDGVVMAARYQTAGGGLRVGGDFYDVYPAAEPGGESMIVLGDVCGRGLKAAVLTGKLRTALGILQPVTTDHRELLDRLNTMVLLGGDPNTFVTLVLASVRHLGPRVQMRLTSAGHPAPLIVRGDGRVEEVPTAGTLIGALDDIDAVTASVELAKGETCLLHTDGVTEARGGPLGNEFFGDERLREELSRCGGMPPDALVERVHMLASEWIGDGFGDDMAVVAMGPRPERLPRDEGATAR
ncbi:PP2C family protein-serine/threonine phosphatase [Actinocorallia longicatena]|uniref:PP2C family protein-serine/threonine phosphatase n=1 Tax=Actinocorallia longicatena TaxID=111803 RepID=A0ABP6QKH1_9ACTN